MKEPVQCDQEQGSWMWTDGILVPPGSTLQGELGRFFLTPLSPGTLLCKVRPVVTLTQAIAWRGLSRWQALSDY